MRRLDTTKRRLCVSALLALLAVCLWHPSAARAVLSPNFGGAHIDLTSVSPRTTSVRGETTGFNLVVDSSNSGDWRLTSNGSTLKQSEGVLIAVPNTLTIPNGNARPRAFVEVPGEVTSALPSFTDGAWLSLTDISGGGVENNFGVSLGFFPFADGWRAGHVHSSGAVLAGNGATNVTQTDIGRFELRLPGVDPASGILFSIGAENQTSGNTVPNGLLADGTGWDLRINDQGANFAAAGNADSEFSFVFVPYSTPNLTAGYIDDNELGGGNGAVISGVGTFSVTPLATTGEYLLSGPGMNPDEGFLLVGVTDEVLSAGILAPEDNFLVHEFDANLGGYVVKSLDLNGAGDQTVQWTFAFVPYEAAVQPQPTVPEPTSLVLALLGVAALSPRRRRGHRPI